MEKNTKILIIICVILVAVLSLTIGLLLGNQNNTPSVLNTTNNSTPTVNTSVTQNQSQTTKSNKQITASQAETIALKYGKKFEPDAQWSAGKAAFVATPNNWNVPFYMILLSNNAPVKPGVARAMDVRVNAQTGAIIS